ncbi:DUF6358 family protein [Pelobium manganitolerans]|uniref:DUF6358 family protein n=1 Tax=Pelobium manganitolerans TaxID=1842495 RepID=UPI003FA37355
MFKHFLFSIVLNFLIIGSVIIGFYGYKAGNYYFIPLLCAAAFGLSVYYKIRHTKMVRDEIRKKSEAKTVPNSGKKKKR